MEHLSFQVVPSNLDVYHHGILGQKWGIKNGPPYPLDGGDYTKTEKEKIYRVRLKSRNSIYNKKHFDEVLEKDKTTLSTLSYDKNRINGTDMFYATHTYLDKQQYNALFNRKLPSGITDSNGNPLGTTNGYKFKINTKINTNIKVASEDSGAKVFLKLYNKDRDFYNFVHDETRMESHFVKEKYKFKGYRDAKNVLDKMQNPDYKPTDTDVKVLYRMFNYVLPSDAGGDARRAKDVATQRAKFFKELSNQGYSAVLDTNDAIYGGFKAKSPVIVFDMDKIIPDTIKETTVSSKIISNYMFLGRKLLKL